MLNTTLQKKINSRINDAELNINTKIDIFVQEVNSLMNKQELLLKAINEDRLVITKILEHMEEIKGNDHITNKYLADHTNRIAKLEKQNKKGRK